MAGNTAVAARLKEQGNTAFRSKRYSAAEELYTDAIVSAAAWRRFPACTESPQTLCPTVSVFFSNRGMARLKQGKFALVLQDGHKAVELDEGNAKGHFLRGVGLCGTAGEDAGGVAALQRGVQYIRAAQRLSERQGKPKLLLQQYEREAAARETRLWALRLALQRAREAQYVSLLHSLLPPAAAGSSTAAADGADSATALLGEMISHFEGREAGRADAECAAEAGDVPAYAACSITFEAMADPVVSAVSGHTYERAAIERWLASKGEDPVTRQPTRASDLVPNIALRGAIEAWLGEHPWARPAPG